MKIQLVLISEIGTFTGYPLDVNENQYNILKDKSSKYYEEGGFEMIDEDGNWIIIAPDIVKKSVLKINVLKNVQE